MKLKAGKIYRVIHSGKRSAQLWGDGAESVGRWKGQLDLPFGRELRFVGMKPGDWGPDEPVFEDVVTGKKGYFSPSYGISDRRGMPGMPLKGWLSENRDKGKSMKITKRQLKRIIQEERARILSEQEQPMTGLTGLQLRDHIRDREQSLRDRADKILSRGMALPAEGHFWFKTSGANELLNDAMAALDQLEAALQALEDASGY